MSRLRQIVRTPARYPLRCFGVAAVLALSGYWLWEVTPGARFRRAYAATERALSEFDFTRARQSAADCIRLRPEDPTARLLAAQAARRDGDLDEATDRLRQYHDLIGDTNETERLEWAMLDAQRGSVHQIVHFLIECVEIRHPASERILESLVIGCIHTYQFDLAGFWIHELLERFPKNPVGRLVRAQTGETLGHRDKAIDTLRELIADFPKYAKARLQLAQLLLQAQEYTEAATQFEVLNKDEPQNAIVLLGLSRCRILQGRGDDAKPLIRMLEEHYSNLSEALLECGRFANSEGRFADAERLLQRALDLAPSDHEIRLQLGVCLEQIGRRPEAIQHLERAKQIEADLARMEKVVEAIVKNPTDPTPRLEAAQICLRNGQDAEGLRWLEGVLERHPNHKEAHKALADYYSNHGNVQQADYHRRRSH